MQRLLEASMHYATVKAERGRRTSREALARWGGEKAEGGEGQACIVELTYVFECTFILVSLQFIFRRIRFIICVEFAIFNFVCCNFVLNRIQVAFALIISIRHLSLFFNSYFSHFTMRTTALKRHFQANGNKC